MAVPSSVSSSSGTPSPGSFMSSTGTWICRSSGLRRPVSTTVHSRLGPTRNLPTSDSGRCVALRPIRWTRPAGGVLEPLERQRQVRAALGLRDRVDLVDDHPLGVAEDLARPRGQHQVERLGRRDQHVGRLAQHLRALALRRVAGADGDLDLAADALQRRAQVALDVVATAPSAATRRRAASCARRRPSGWRPGGRAPTGTRRASCRCRSAPTRARGRPWRSRARPASAPRSGPRRHGRTSHGPAE